MSLMKPCLKLILSAAAVLFLSSALRAQERTLHIVTTGDVHGAWFDRPYVAGQGEKASLMSVKSYVDSLRSAVGERNVLLLDDGDCLQGDNAAYYFNYVRTDVPHLYPRIAQYMGYDAIVVGNHDIETGHKVYDRVASELLQAGIPWLGGNALRLSDGKPYFPAWKIFARGGMRVALLGFTNPNMKAWLSEPVWRGMDFVSLVPYVQECVDEVRAAEKPDAVVVAVHSGTGNGDGSILESQGLDLLHSLRGVDVLVCAHDHRPCVERRDGCVLLNAGSRAGNVGHAVISLDGESRTVSGEVVKMKGRPADSRMREAFCSEYEEVKAFTGRKVGHISMELRTRDAYRGMSDYVNLVHTVQIGVPEAQISFAAPLTYDGSVKEGDVVYNDMFTIYPYENQLFVLRLKGSEIKNYLEYSYDGWIQTPGEHLLRIADRADERTGARRWSFVSRPYNFDSAAGLVYTVDVTKAFGERVKISSTADGAAFDEDGWYNVAMTSYRANGGGDILLKGAGLSKEEAERRVIARYPEIRDMVYEFISSHEEITPALIGDPSVIGEWRFVPEKKASKLLDADMKLIF